MHLVKKKHITRIRIKKQMNLNRIRKNIETNLRKYDSDQTSNSSGCLGYQIFLLH